MKQEIPKKVCKALDDFMSSGHDVDYIMFRLSESCSESPLSGRLKVIHEYAEENGFELANALVNGYYSIEEDITVVVTPEQQANIKGYYNHHDTSELERTAVEITLGNLKLKIKGVNTNE